MPLLKADFLRAEVGYLSKKVICIPSSCSAGRVSATVAGEPAAALLGVFPGQWQALDADAQQAHLSEQVQPLAQFSAL